METLRYSWFWLAKGYLSLSRQGVIKLGKERKDGELDFIIAAILFNLKHAIELILKSGMVTKTESFDKNHNLDLLSNRLRKETKTKSKHLNSLVKISKKYHNFNFSKRKFKKANFFDIENEVFRYPISSNKKYILSSEVIKRFDRGDILEISRDIDQLDKIMSKLYPILRREAGANSSLRERHMTSAVASLLAPRISKRKISAIVRERNRNGQPISRG